MQISYIKEYINHRDDLMLLDVFADKRCTGMNFDRPEFERLLKALQERKIDCIVVKDFSRLGRNFVETGQYLEQVFPLFGVRFIAINDNYDSLNRQSRDGMLVPIKSMKKYRSYKGEVGKIAPNLLNRDFHAEKPNQKSSESRIFSGSIRRAAMLVWKQFLSGVSGTRSSYGECMTAFAECSAGKHGKAAAFGQNTHISVHQRQMFVKLLSILRPCNVHGFCL